MRRSFMVGVAQLVRVPDCDSGCRGFESHRSPQFDPTTMDDGWQKNEVQTVFGPLAQLVEQVTLNHRVQGSNP